MPVAALLRRLRGQEGAKKDARKYRVGVCAMDKKAKSKQMVQIIDRLNAYGEFEIVIFGDQTILHKPVEEWPRVDCLLSWFSDGFPLAKAQAYARLRKPFLVNDLAMQDILLDRIQVYRTLVRARIPVPTHIIVDRTGLPAGEDPPGFVEAEEYVEMDGQRIFKPFVEKPRNAEDHNIWIYYNMAAGGGVKKLFRKVDNKSSCYDSTHSGHVRRDGSYIYEEFLATGGTDVKVYTVGPSYAHAEARKSPVVDGKVLRTADGKEMRFPVLLTPQEKEVARLVVNAFKQAVCGFDLLRSDKGVSYVCDVNGWSFVKNSRRYYDDTAGILRSILIGGVDPLRLSAVPNPTISFSALGAPSLVVPGLAEDDAALLDDQEGASDDELLLQGLERELERTDARTQQEELRCVLAVIRHGDRTPKQKLKIKVTAEPLLSLFHKYKDNKGKQAKLKTPGQLQELLDITRDLLAALERVDEVADTPPSPPATAAANGNGTAAPAAAGTTGVAGTAGAAGISDADTVHLSHMLAAATAAAAAMTADERKAALEFREKLRIVKTVLEQASFNGINRKVQLKPTKWGFPSGAMLPNNNSTLSASTFHVLSPMDSTAPDASLARTNPINTSLTSMIQAGALASNAGVEKGGAGESGGGDKSGTATPMPTMVLEEALMVVKWGGVLTHAGRQQAEDLGKVFRLVMYPRYGSAGGGLLRLHSTYRHDLKIYSSDEGRVQASAAAFAKGLLDLEGTSLTPILVSLVKKDASMLEAFGKGASDDISAAKTALYQAMTSDNPERPLPGSLMPASPVPQSNLPPVSPARLSATNVAVSTGSPAGLAVVAEGAADGQQVQRTSSLQIENSARISVAQSQDITIAADGPSTAPSGVLSTTNSVGVPPASAQLSRAASMQRSTAGFGTRVPYQAIGPIKNLPDAPLVLLRRLVELMKALVGQLRELCLQERVGKRGTDPLASGVGGGRPAGVGSRYSSVSHEPAEWVLEPGRPCSGERMLLMFDRYQKLYKSFYNEKKDTFDISKVPDIYDSAKYDAIHNAHLGVDMRELYSVSKQLADAVIPSEYGIDPVGKLRIGSTIATELLGKLLVDLAAMREESLANPDMPDGSAPPYSKSSRNTSLHGNTANKQSKPPSPALPTAAREAGTAAPVMGQDMQNNTVVVPASASGGVKGVAREVKEAMREAVEDMAAAAKGAFEKLEKFTDRIADKVDTNKDKEQLQRTGRAESASSLGSGPPQPNPASAVTSATTSAAAAASSTPATSQQTGAGVDKAAGGEVEGRKLGEPGDGKGEDDSEDGERPERPVQTDEETRPEMVPMFRCERATGCWQWAAVSGMFTEAKELSWQLQIAVADGNCGKGADNASTVPVEAEETIHRLCPEYAPHINSPLRHVRTRIYFTSESHIHSLVNVLRYSHLFPLAQQGQQAQAGASIGKEPSEGGAGPVTSHLSTNQPPTGSAPNLSTPHTSLQGNLASPTAQPNQASAAAANFIGTQASTVANAGGAQGGIAAAAPATVALAGGKSPLCSPAGCTLLDQTNEFDYLTHIVFRLYENKAVPVSSPERFRVEIMFSPGANANPFHEQDKFAAQQREAAAAAARAQDAAGPADGPSPVPMETDAGHADNAQQTSTTMATATAAAASDAATAAVAVSPTATVGRNSVNAAVVSDGVPPHSLTPTASAQQLQHSESTSTVRGMAAQPPTGGCRGPAWHVLPVLPRVHIHEGHSGVTLSELEDALLPMAKVYKFAPPSYAQYLSQRLGNLQLTGAQGGTTGGQSRLQSRFSSAVNMREAAYLTAPKLLYQHGGTDTPVSQPD